MSLFETCDLLHRKFYFKLEIVKVLFLVHSHFNPLQNLSETKRDLEDINRFYDACELKLNNSSVVELENLESCLNEHSQKLTVLYEQLRNVAWLKNEFIEKKFDILGEMQAKIIASNNLSTLEQNQKVFRTICGQIRQWVSEVLSLNNVNASVGIIVYLLFGVFTKDFSVTNVAWSLAKYPVERLKSGSINFLVPKITENFPVFTVRQLRQIDSCAAYVLYKGLNEGFSVTSIAWILAEYLFALLMFSLFLKVAPSRTVTANFIFMFSALALRSCQFFQPTETRLSTSLFFNAKKEEQCSVVQSALQEYGVTDSKSYRQVALMNHPDKNSTGILQEVNGLIARAKELGCQFGLKR